MTSMATMKGVRDVPISGADEDALQLTRYARALADFVQQCDTPMTVGIQGDWGSGKTSLMQLMDGLIREQGGPRTYTLNTWQYAQITDSSHLSLIVIQALYAKLAQEQSRVQQAFAGMWKAFRSMKKLEFGGFGVELDGGKREAGAELVDVEKLKEDFARLVAEPKVRGDHDRVIVFVDDLDRVLPERAVEILEALKNFVDVPGCVFVIACDYEVVRKGLKAKFHVGEDELQGRSFFDKIIQVPFRMPVHSYDVAAYVARMLRRIGWSFLDDDLADYRAFLENSVGFNPRSIKRLCNTLLLLKAVATGDQDERTRTLLEDRGRLKILFALVCLEAQYEKAHAALRRLDDEAALGRMLLEPEKSLKERFGDTIEGVTEDARPRLVGLLEALGKVVDADGNGYIDAKECIRLQEMVRLSAITSVASDESASRPQRRTAEEILALAEKHGIRHLLEPLRSALQARIQAGCRVREQTARTTISYYAPKQLWGEGSGSNSVLQCVANSDDKVFRLQLVTESFERMNKKNPKGWAALRSYLKQHPADLDLGWGPAWSVVELQTAQDVKEFLGVLTGVVPFA